MNQDEKDIKFLLNVIDELEHWLTQNPPFMIEARKRIMKIKSRLYKWLE